MKEKRENSVNSGHYILAATPKVNARGQSICIPLYSYSLHEVILALVEVLNKGHTKQGTDRQTDTERSHRGGYRVAPQLKKPSIQIRSSNISS